MTSKVTVIYDACILYSNYLRDILIQLAIADLFRAKWTNLIHDEWIRNHIRKQFPYNFYVSFVKDEVKLESIGHTKIDAPTFIKSNIYHQVDNEGNDTRMVFVIRFKELEYYESLDYVIEYRDLVD